MKTFIIRARKGSTRWEKIRSQVGSHDHFEIIAHCIINAFFVSSNFRTDVEVYIVLDSSEDFPWTIRLCGNEGLSIPGFHEDAVISLIENTLKKAMGIKKDQVRHIENGIEVHGYGFERLMSHLSEERPIYVMDNKGDNIRNIEIDANPVFVLSDHLMMPKKSMGGLKRQGLNKISLGKKMLFASQCVVLLNHEMDLQGI